MLGENEAREQIQALWQAKPEAEREPELLYRFFIHDLQQHHPETLHFGMGRGPYAWQMVQEWCG